MAYFSAQGTMLSGNLSHYPAAHYKKQALDQLWKKFQFMDACMKDSLPQRSGKTVTWFRYGNLAANTTARVTGASGGGGVTEGTIGAGTTLSSSQVSVTVSQYANYIAVSDYARDTIIDDVLKAAAKNLGYEAGLSVDTITRAEIDSAAGAVITTLSTYFSASDSAQAAHILKANDVEPMEDGTFYGVIHPYVSYDLINDPQAGGFLDMQKYSNPSAINKRDMTRGFIGTIHGVSWHESTNVKIDTVPNPDTYRAYVFGKEGVGCVDLEGKGPSQVKDPKKQQFKINVIEGGADKSDPEGVIGGAVAYNYKYAAKILQTSPYRFRMFDAICTLVP